MVHFRFLAAPILAAALCSDAMAARMYSCPDRRIVTGTVFGTAQLERLAGNQVPFEVVQLASLAALLEAGRNGNGDRFWTLGLLELGRVRGMAYVDDHRPLFQMVYANAVGGSANAGISGELTGEILGGVAGGLIGLATDDWRGAAIGGAVGSRIGGNYMSRMVGEAIGDRIEDNLLSEAAEWIVSEPCAMTAKEAEAELKRMIE